MNKMDIWAFARDALGEEFANEKSAEEIVGLGCNIWTPPTNTTFFGAHVAFDVVVTTEEVIYRRQKSNGKFAAAISGIGFAVILENCFYIC